MIPVVLSGGSGTRLWPVSRKKMPKQFAHLFERSLQELTLERLSKISSPWVVTSQDLQDLTQKCLRTLNLNAENVIYEPQQKNTTAAIATLCKYFSDLQLTHQVVGVFAADHLIEKEQTFYSAIHLAKTIAENGKIVTLGITPTRPDTGFGYIQTEPTEILSHGDLKSYSVVKFHEKPSTANAQKFVSEGTYHWNAGIFIFQISQMIEAFKTYQPQTWSIIETLKQDLSNISEVYSKLDNISIDYSIMEKLSSKELACIPCDLGWSDVGSWDAIAELLGDNFAQKVEVGAVDNFVHSYDKQKVYGFCDVKDLLVVDTPDALLIAKKGSSQKVKDAYDILKLKVPKIVSEHIYEERPWGRFEILKDTEKFKSKTITVNPGHQLSYQSHAKREEHWLITAGNGQVVLNDQVILVSAGQYIHIPLGAKHRICNHSDQPLEFVEVQLGSYFGEDDIVRYQDDYNRQPN